MIDHLPALWTPKIGQRVRVKLSGECKQTFNQVYSHSTIEGHYPQEDGAIGKVFDATAKMTPETREKWLKQTHTILVAFEKPIAVFGCILPIGGAAYAPHELVPVFAPGDRVRIRDAARYCTQRHVGEPGQPGRIVNRYESTTGHVWTVALEEIRIGAWDAPAIDEFCDEEIEPL